LEQLDAMIEDISRLMLGSTRTASEERLSRRVVAVAVGWSGWKIPKTYLGSRRISNSLEGKCMSRSS